MIKAERISATSRQTSIPPTVVLRFHSGHAGESRAVPEQPFERHTEHHVSGEIAQAQSY
ncbi:MAG: hypothetical protein P9M14_05895 [Candidatus Alcyoniella australis]|nr:hypothetical protein [Candidatus Alcyoniella australis]